MFLEREPTVIKALISTKGNPHKYSTLKLRPICYASHIDSLIYAYYGRILSQSYEGYLDDNDLNNNVLAFRPAKEEKLSNIHHANNAFKLIDELETCVVLAFDVSSFFDILDHQVLKNAWLTILNSQLDIENQHVKLPNDHYSVFKSLTNYSYVDRENVYDIFGISSNNPSGISQQIIKEMKYKSLNLNKYPETKGRNRSRICSTKGFREFVVPIIKKNKKPKGIPQGSPMSGLLSNIFMIDFDKELKSYLSKKSGHYVRYCDDLLCIVPIKNRDEIFSISRELEGFVYQLAQNFKLEVNKKKTEKFAFMPTFQLGAKFQGEFFPRFPLRKSSSLACAKIENNGTLTYDKLQYLGFNYDGSKVTIRSSSMMRYKKKMKRGINYHLKLRNKHAPDDELKTRKLAFLYDKSFKGLSNFPTYAKRANNILEKSAVRYQMKGRTEEIQRQIEMISIRIEQAKQRKEYAKNKNKNKNKLAARKTKASSTP